MTEYQKTYIELKKQFVATNEGPDSVRALYTFKEELEQSEDQQAKEVLVDVYDLLDFKKDAYELLCQIGNRSDKKTLKRLGTLKDYAENWGNHYALPKPKTPEEKQKEKERQAQLGLPFLFFLRLLWQDDPYFLYQSVLFRGGYCISVPGVYRQRRGGPEI